MNGKHKNPSSFWRHFIWRGLTVLMFFYLCADVSVLEYFCGNPSLGIVSYRQIVEFNPPSAEASKTSAAQNTVDDLGSSKHNEEESDIPFDGDDCFCCSSHAVITYNYLIVITRRTSPTGAATLIGICRRFTARRASLNSFR